ncbi:uncharacterized protein F5891DRAFT_1207513 [Suillus fuscotomentosus]|uniref:Uncharacterized protein n=1 Tax=Suillus fuscotomentosus TaxID=1912939 RepID=A0AAD4EE59_9AGAM|nr:uncharacterized protein F5891DRAFT_1207513 [Suillus fuscotomentosus]KAG1904460.1 hypothetical protein F5891DRAFT_1207513 [Suillus fuscotomentosus]
MSLPSSPVPSPDSINARLPSSLFSTPVPSRTNTPVPNAPDHELFTSLPPLYRSLISSLKSPTAADAELLLSIPMNNNPRPLRSVFNDNTDYWVGADDNVLRLTFPAKLHLEGRYNKSGEYFNLPDTGLDLGDIKNAKIQFEVLPLDDKEKDCPASAVGCSQFAMKLLFTLHSEVEEARNASCKDASAVPSNVPFWCTYKEDDKYSLVVTAGAIFRDVPDMKTATAPRLSRAEAADCPGLMSPSKVRASAKKYTQVLGENKGKKSGNRWWRICDLEDSKGRYSALLNTYDLRGTRVQSPDVHDEHGVQIHVSEYKTKLMEGAIVELEVILKLWTIKPCSNNASNPRDANGSHVYQMMLQHMQLLPCEKYMQAAFINSIKDGKRKATDEASEAMEGRYFWIVQVIPPTSPNSHQSQKSSRLIPARAQVPNAQSRSATPSRPPFSWRHPWRIILLDVMRAQYIRIDQEYAIKILDKNHLIRKNKMLVTLAEKDILVKLGNEWSLCTGSSSSDGSPVIDPVAADFDVKMRIDLDTEKKLEPSLSVMGHRSCPSADWPSLLLPSECVYPRIKVQSPKHHGSKLGPPISTSLTKMKTRQLVLTNIRLLCVKQKEGGQTYSAETSAVSTVRVEKALVHSAHLQTWAQAWRPESKCNTTPSSCASMSWGYYAFYLNLGEFARDSGY